MIRRFIFSVFLLFEFELTAQSIIDQLIGVYNNSILVKQVVFSKNRNEVYFFEKNILDNRILWIKQVEQIDYKNDKQYSIKQYYDAVEMEKPYIFKGFDYLEPIPLNEYDSKNELLNMWVSEEIYSPVTVRKYLPKEIEKMHIVTVLSVYYHLNYYIILVRLYDSGVIYDKIVSFPESDIPFYKQKL
jgi:hypothetical protein